MKALILGFAILFSTFSNAHAEEGNFNGAKPAPFGRAKESVSQLRIQFPESMVKQANEEAFSVSCSPARMGFASWADNDSIWTFDFKAEGEEDSMALAGGTSCEINQVAELRSTNGTVWAPGTIKYSVIVPGPNVVRATTSFRDTLRETDPVILLTFDGPVNKDKFFAEQNAYLSYDSANAPSEKIALQMLPADKMEEVVSYFNDARGSDLNPNDHTWILATVKQALIPGAKMILTVEGQSAEGNPNVKPDAKFTKEFVVRSQFQAEKECTTSGSDDSTCMPQNPITVRLNGFVKWADIKDAYVEYIPFKSGNKRTVRTYAEIPSDKKIGFWDDVINNLSYYFPFLARFSDTVVDSVEFKVNIEPQTLATVVLPRGLTDIEGRALAGLSEFKIKIAAMTEMVRVARDLSIFEKKVKNLAFPVGIVNQNQTISVRKSGQEPKEWQPISDVSEMIRVIRAYQSRGDYRETKEYVSPLAQLNVPNTNVDQKLMGQKNRNVVLQFPFSTSSARRNQNVQSGLYAIEVSSPSFEAMMSDEANNSFYNPKYSLAQVTDLTVQLKKGTKSTVAWVTSLSTGKPVPGAAVDIYNCLGEKKATFTANESGLAIFQNEKWATDCAAPENNGWSGYFQPEYFYAVARAGDDFALVHSSWTSSASYALGAPGIEWFYNDISEGTPHFHAVIGVNLVKPGQNVPVEIYAKLPTAHGFQELNAADLPKVARIVSSEDDNTFYEFPLQWKNGKAEIKWNIPSDSSTRLGRYTINVKSGEYFAPISSGDIEVAEFKVPLMSGIIAFPNESLVQPSAIPVSAVIRYANGVGAKDLPVDMAYYFSPTSLESKELPNFSFGTGPMTASDRSDTGDNKLLPDSTRPGQLEGLKTGTDGSISKDIAQERSNGDDQTIGQVIQTLDRPQKLVVRVRYRDSMGEFQTLSQAKDIFNASTYVGTYVKAGARADARLQAAVVNVEGKNITNASDLSYKLIRVETRVIGEELFGGMIKNTLERELKPARWQPKCALEDKVVSCPVGALKEGTYAFEVTSKASEQVAHSTFKVAADGRVYGPNDYYNFGDDEGSRQLPLALDKPSYKNGEKAVVSFAAPFEKCQALVTLERSDVMQAFVAPNACKLGQVLVPVDASQAPNTFVSVLAVTGRVAATNNQLGEKDLGKPTYKLGFANMKIDWQRFTSKVVVTTDKPKYEPGQFVKVNVAVTPEEGKLAGGTVTIVAIEEKILELKPNDTYKVLDALMQMRGHNVETITALEQVETTTTDNADLEMGAPERKGGDEGGDGGSRSDFKRKLFNALVKMETNIPVVNGVATYSFQANDSLTKFKIFAIATDSAQKFGLGEVSYLSEKDTQSYSNIPTVAHTGDIYPMKVTLQNNGSAAMKYKVVITETVRDAKGNVISEKTYEKEATIDKAGSKDIDVGETTVADGASSVQYQIRVYDENGKLVDSMEPEAQTVLPAVPLAIHHSMVAQMDSGSYQQILEKEKDALPGQGGIRVVAAKSLVTSAITQISQRLDRDLFADFFIESRFNRALIKSSAAKPDELVAVLNTMLGYTDDSGFVKYAPQQSRGSVYFTAFILQSLSQEPWAMKLVPEALQAKWKKAIASVLDKSVSPVYIGTSPMDWYRAQTAMALGAFAFPGSDLVQAAKDFNASVNEALKTNPAVYGETMDKWTNGDLVEKWLLEAYATPESALSSETYALLTGPSRLVYTGNMAQLNGSPSYRLYYSDEVLETSKLLLGVAKVKGSSSLARALAVGLVNANTSKWYNVATMMGVTQGLKGFGRAYEAEQVSGVATLAVPEEQQLVQVDFNITDSGGFSSAWTQEKATVKVNHNGAGHPWISLQALSAVPLKAPRNQGITLERTIKNLTRDSGFQAGDELEIKITVHANSNIKNVALMDPIPSGSNVVGDAFGYYTSAQANYSGYKFFFEELNSGANTVTYHLQLNNPGTFQLPPTRAEGLYTPSIFAEIPNAPVKVE